MNKHTLALLVAAFAAVAADANANEGAVSPSGRDLGFGIEFGAPANLNLKLMVAPNQGVVVGLGVGAWYDASLSLHVDYLLHPIVLPYAAVTLSGYVGVGAWASAGIEGAHYGYYQPWYGRSPFGVGARIPLGVNLAFNQAPLELYMELVPAVALMPGFGVFSQGGIGLRLYI